jgi:hypothetical protein
MFELTHKHLELITADVSKADISFSHLKYDLIDHICCDLENEMNQGLPFEKAYEKVKKEIGIRGLQQIQEDTLLLIDKKYRIMKNTMKIFGAVAPILMAFGSLFKIEHWPFGGILLTLGFFLLCFVFLPSAVYVSYREVSNRKKLLAHLSGFLAAFLFAVSFLFIIQHWPGAGMLLFIAAIITGLFFIPAIFINQLKECPKNQRIAFVFGLIGSLSYLAGFVFKIFHWPGAAILILCGSLFLIIIGFPLFIVRHYKNYEHVSSRFIFLSFAVLWFVIPISLIALNVSGDAFIGLKLNGEDKEYNIKYLTSKNNILFTKFEAGTSQESAKIKEYATKVKINADELVDYIQSVKIRIISLDNGVAIDPHQQINISNIDNKTYLSTVFQHGFREGGAPIQQVLFNEGEAQKLKEKIEVFRLYIEQNSGIDSISANLVSQILSIFSGTEKTDLNKISEHLNIIPTFNNLSDIQEKVLIAERIVFQSLSKKAGSKQLLVSSK